MLCTSGFVDDVMFPIMALRHVVCIPLRGHTTSVTAEEISTEFCSTIKITSTHRELPSGGEVC